jgi:NAD-dependent SIR2 family protein deacetylase
LNGAAERAAALLAQADALVVAAGAGIGVDSGLPDFRGDAGFWKAYPALGRERIAFHKVASPDAFRSQPRLAWGFYGHRLALYRATRPHAGFGLLRRWSGAMPRGGFVYTSNVDGQFKAAGFDGQRVLECHGSIHHLQCSLPCGDQIWSADGLQPQIDVERCQWLGELPMCPHCGALARPAILMFGDGEWNPRRSFEQHARLEHWLASVRRPVVVEIGAGTAIPSVRDFVDQVMSAHGGRLIRINPRESGVTDGADIGMALGALAGLRLIDAALGA